MAIQEPEEDAEPVEQAIEPGLPIIDPHHHVRDRLGSRYMFDDFLADLSACGHNIRATVMIESGDMFRAGGPPELRPVGETEFLNGVAAMFASGKYSATLRLRRHRRLPRFARSASACGR